MTNTDRLEKEEEEKEEEDEEEEEEEEQRPVQFIGNGVVQLHVKIRRISPHHIRHLRQNEHGRCYFSCLSILLFLLSFDVVVPVAVSVVASHCRCCFNVISLSRYLGQRNIAGIIPLFFLTRKIKSGLRIPHQTTLSVDSYAFLS